MNTTVLHLSRPWPQRLLDRLRNLLLSLLAKLPLVRRQLAWRLSGLVYR